MKLITKNVFCSLILILNFLLFSCSKNFVSHKINDNWKIYHGDNKSFCNDDFDDSSWEIISVLKNITLDNSHYVWLRKSINIPSDIRSGGVWFGFMKCNCAAEVYADGIYIGTRGKMPPSPNIRGEQTCDFLIPSNLYEDDGNVVISIRLYGAGTSVSNLDFNLDDGETAYFQNNVRNIFNQRIFLILAVVCAFIMFYSIANFFSDRSSPMYLYFAFCLFFIIFYFADLGAENLFLQYNVQRALSKSFLSVSMMFMALFLNAFFDRKHGKELQMSVFILSALDVAIFLINAGKDKVVDTLFTAMLTVVFGVVIYGFVVVAKAGKARAREAWPLVLGFTAGSCIAIHDVICQIIGVVPFMWLQGFSFFFMDIAVFITLTRKAADISKEVTKLAAETKLQRDKLAEVFDNARELANESVSIAYTLEKSVGIVQDSAILSKNKVDEINRAIGIQRKVQNETQSAMEHLNDFLESLNEEFEHEAAMIAATAQGTLNVIDGIQTVGVGINTAAQFTSGLSNVTASGSKDMKLLMNVMKNIQDSSKEILGVVTTLDDFAQQTDLLAMNASIEAAHSGEAGKGFSVIAHEIKELASKTSQWSARIGEIISAIIEQIEMSVDLSHKVNFALSEIESGSIESANTVNSAAQGMKIQHESGLIISRESQNLSDSAVRMKNEVLSQSKYADKVVGDMQELSRIFRDVEDASLGISGQSANLSEQVKSLSELVVRISDAAQDMLELMK